MQLQNYCKNGNQRDPRSQMKRKLFLLKRKRVYKLGNKEKRPQAHHLSDRGSWLCHHLQPQCTKMMEMRTALRRDGEAKEQTERIKRWTW